MNKLQKSALIGFGAVILSTVAIQASDLATGINANLTGLVSQSNSTCGDGAVEFLFGTHALCVDMYEASSSKDCPHDTFASQVETQNNLNESDCVPQSEPEKEPWRFVSLTQAQQLCARVGKRLPKNDEWYKIVSGFSDQSSCITDNGNSPEPTGSSVCVTPSGVYDMVGNVWEWVDEEVIDGVYGTRELPASGYVALVDTNGVVLETDTKSVEDFDEDYAWTKDSGVSGMIRGGFYGSGSDAGIFAQNLSVPLDFKTAGVGFRCVRDI